jgi:hypothetical protein
VLLAHQCHRHRCYSSAVSPVLTSCAVTPPVLQPPVLQQCCVSCVDLLCYYPSSASTTGATAFLCFYSTSATAQVPTAPKLSSPVLLNHQCWRHWCYSTEPHLQCCTGVHSTEDQLPTISLPLLLSASAWSSTLGTAPDHYSAAAFLLAQIWDFMQFSLSLSPVDQSSGRCRLQTVSCFSSLPPFRCPIKNTYSRG